MYLHLSELRVGYIQSVQTISMRATLSPSAIVEGLDSLPAFPRIVMDILDTLNDESVDTGMLADLIQHDSVIVGQLLYAANCVNLYKQGAAICCIHDAIQTLGVRRIREIALTVRLLDFMDGLGADASFSEHGLTVGICAQELLRHAEFDSSKALVAGILHDIGRFWLFNCYPRTTHRHFEHVEVGSHPLIKIERELFGMDHCEIGHCIANAWRLPEEICSSILLHHQLIQHPPNPLQAAIYLSEIICNTFNLPIQDNNLDIDDRVLTTLSLNWNDDIGNLLAQVEARVKQVKLIAK